MKVLVTMEPMCSTQESHGITSQVLEFETSRSQDITPHMETLAQHFKERGVAIIWKTLPEI